MKNNTTKAFDNFVSRNFFGYSAHTLYQELCHSYPAEVASIAWLLMNMSALQFLQMMHLTCISRA